MQIRFYNKMEFPVNLRKVWEKDSPAITLKTGEVIQGPYEILTQFPFLSPLMADFSMIDSMTQNNKMEYTDNKVEEIQIPERYRIPMDVKKDEPAAEYEPEPINKQIAETVIENHSPIIKQNEKETDIIEKDIVKNSPEIDIVDFDPRVVNWLTIKVEQLERACKALNIDMSFLNDKKPKEKKWELVKLIKIHYKI